MTIATSPLASLPIAAEGAVASSSGSGALAPFAGVGTQGTIEFRGERFWAAETQTRFRARESDSQEMLGTTDKTPLEKVWYECDFLDLLNGADITSLTLWTQGTMSVVSSETESNGAQVHLARALVTGVGVGEVSKLTYIVQCSDGALRARSLKIRGREL